MSVCRGPGGWGTGKTKVEIGGDVVFADDSGLTEADDDEYRQRWAMVWWAKSEKFARGEMPTLTDVELARLLPEAGDGGSAAKVRVTPALVRDIRRLHGEGLRNKQIARKLGVPAANVNRILLGRSWGHVT